MMKKIYFAIPSLAIALHLLLSNLLYFLVERLVLDVFHISPQQFMNYSYWGEILIYAVLRILVTARRSRVSSQLTITGSSGKSGTMVMPLLTTVGSTARMPS